MAYKCRICGNFDVEEPGGICGMCALGTDQTYVPGKGRSRKIIVNVDEPDVDTDPYGNPAATAGSSDVKVYEPGQTPQPAKSSNLPKQAGNTSSGSTFARGGAAPVTSGITKNIAVDKQKTFFLQKLCRTLFGGVPYNLDDEITLFQVFPSYSGGALNSSGNACDQVIVYGKMNAGAIAENNDVEVYGHRDSRNNIIASTIINRATGTVNAPYRVISPLLMWIIVVFTALAIFGIVSSVKLEGMIGIIILILIILNLPFILKLIFWIVALMIFRRR